MKKTTKQNAIYKQRDYTFYMVPSTIKKKQEKRKSRETHKHNNTKKKKTNKTYKMMNS